MSSCPKCGELLSSSEHLCKVTEQNDSSGKSVKHWISRVLLGAPVGYFGGLCATLPLMLAAMMAFSATREQMKPWETLFLVAAIVLGPAYFILLCSAPAIVFRRAWRLGLAAFVADILMLIALGMSDPASAHSPNDYGVRITFWITVWYTAICYIISWFMRCRDGDQLQVAASSEQHDPSATAAPDQSLSEETASVPSQVSAPKLGRWKKYGLVLVGAGIGMALIVHGGVARYKKIHSEEVWDAMRSTQVDVVLHTVEPGVPCTRLTPGFIYGGVFDMRDNTSPTKYHVVPSMQLVRRGQDWFEIVSPLTSGVPGDAQRAVIKFAEGSYGIDARPQGSDRIREEDGAVLTPLPGHTREECHPDLSLKFTPFEGSPISESVAQKYASASGTSSWGSGSVLGFKSGESLRDAGNHAGQLGMTQFEGCANRYSQFSGTTDPDYVDCHFSGPDRRLQISLYKLRLQRIEYDFPRKQLGSVVHLVNDTYGACRKDPLSEGEEDGDFICAGSVGQINVGHPSDLAAERGSAYVAAVLGPPSALLGVSGQ